MRMFRRLISVGHRFRRELKVYRLVLSDPRTPRIPKILLALAVGYAVLPFDLIPDFIPVIGHLDDAIIIPVLVILALKLIPSEIVEEHRRHVGS
jgi:uncharacterized membrane protein YkvA (DUF1232 family)